MTLNWGVAILNRLFFHAPAKPAPAPQPVVVEHFAPETEPVRKPQPLDFDDMLRAMGADL